MLYIEDKTFKKYIGSHQDMMLMVALDDDRQILYRKLMHLLVNGNPEQLKRFVKKCKFEMSEDDAYDLFICALDKAKFDNLMWLANYANFDLKSFLNNFYNNHQQVDHSFISGLILGYKDFEPNFSVMMSNLKNIGFNLNRQYEKGFTILHFAANIYFEDKKLQQDLIRALLDNGADPNVRNKDGDSSLKYAVNEEIANYLVQQAECNPRYKYSKKNKTVVIDPKEFTYPDIYAYCLKHGGVDVAISRIESGLLANVVSEVCNSKVNNPAPRRI